MYNLIQQFLKSQKNVSVLIFGTAFLILSSWYVFIFKNLSDDYKNISQSKIQLDKNLKKYRSMQSQIYSLESEWNSLNNDFQNTIQKIPNKKLYEDIADYLYSMIINHGLKIDNFSPSNSAIDKKTIFDPDSGDEILVEKIPVDIVLQGSFINFGQLLESMHSSQYRLTVSNIGINQSGASYSQTIKLISYIYVQSIKNKKKSIQNNIVHSKKEIKETSLAKSQVSNEAVQEAVKSIDKNLKVTDSLAGVPEMWLEPATEPVDKSVVIAATNKTKEEKPKKKKVKSSTEKKIEPEQENSTPAVTIERTEPSQALDLSKFQDYFNVSVLQSKTCEKVKNNLPINPKNRFSSDSGKVYCHSLLNNNSGKHIDIYHIWYMNGNLKAKVRIRVRAGKEIPAISHRVIEKLDVGMWKVEITDSDKKILDTVIFEVV